jgi:hypothetical protein
MLKNTLIVAGFIAAIACMAIAGEAQAQTRTNGQTQIQTQAQPEQKCLRALFDGACTNPAMVEAARQRAIIIPSVRVSYFGTPAGTVTLGDIPFERLFRDDPVVFGLPTNTFVCCNSIKYTK